LFITGREGAAYGDSNFTSSFFSSGLDYSTGLFLNN
jgi:hypothetical protein